MNKVVLIPDSFKGTMSSGEICAILAEQVHRHFPRCSVVSIPVADGGEGSVDCFLAAVGGERKSLTVSNPFLEEVSCDYGVIHGGETAVIEMAACAGLPLIEDRRDPLRASTYGVGQLLVDAANQGVKRIIVGLGGSATNDGGCGAAAAAGVGFYNKKGERFLPAGGTLEEIERIDLSGRNPLLDGVEIRAMCDIDNPMCGPNGASHVFGPQKGADEAMVEALDRGLRHLGEVIRRDLGVDVLEVPGSGAAGAMGAGMLAFFGAGLQMGIETVLDTVGFDDLLRDADCVFTGEGKIDSQSLRGKVVIGVARRAKQANVPVFAVVGDIGDGIEGVYGEGVTAVFSINRVARDFKEVRHRAPSDLALTMDTILRTLKCGLAR